MMTSHKLEIWRTVEVNALKKELRLVIDDAALSWVATSSKNQTRNSSVLSQDISQQISQRFKMSIWSSNNIRIINKL